ncbi:MAG: protein-glutamate O-methyltransferase [Pseudomonadota bacterium]
MPPEPCAPAINHTKTSRAYGLDDAAFTRTADLVRRACGIKLSQTKSNLIVSRLGRRVKSLNFPDFHAYLDFVESQAGRDEQRKMTSLLTTNVTRFFREPHHFESLRKDVLPRLAAKAKSGAEVRIWSAGCSSGEEALSIGMTVLKLCPDAPNLDVRILGTDLDPMSLQTARHAAYSAASLENVAKDLRDQFFEPVNDGSSFRATSRLRDLVTYAELNLIEPWPMQRPFDVIFCRNVMIYFDNATQSALWPRFAAALRPGSMLCIGHSERLSGPGATQFEAAGITQYRRL